MRENLWNKSKYDLSQNKPLPGDVRTKLQKQKGQALADIAPEDLHRHDTVLIMSLNTRGFQRRNLHVTD
jgi:hypothetical protein